MDMDTSSAPLWRTPRSIRTKRVHSKDEKKRSKRRKTGKWDKIMEQVAVDMKEMEARTASSRALMNRYEPDDTKRFRAKGFCSGDLRVRAVLDTLDQFGMKRSEDQKLFHRNFLIACLPKIYGSEWDQHKRRVLREFGIPRIDFEVMIITPRRWGKTVSVAMFVTAILICVPGIEMGIFSTGSRASGSLMEKIVSFIGKIPGAKDRIVKANQEDLFVALERLHGLSAKSDVAVQLRTAPGTSKLHR